MTTCSAARWRPPCSSTCPAPRWPRRYSAGFPTPASVTTSLSRQLLLSAVAGNGLPELQELGQALCQPAAAAAERAWRRLSRIGHSSGTALGIGLLAGARQAVPTRTAAA